MFPRFIILGSALVMAMIGMAQAQVSPGDMNCDSTVNGSDVGPFLLAVIDPSGYAAAYPGCPLSNADFDCDGDADTGDVNGFVDCLLTGNCPPCSAPGMVLIPAGEFQMGDTFTEGDTSELPVHAVYVNTFYIDSCELTNQQYAEALNWAWAQGGLITVIDSVVYQYGSGTNYPYCPTHWNAWFDSWITWNGSTFGVVTGKENHPMVQVTWYGSAAYCNWRSAMEGKALSYDLSTWTCNFGSGYRLPTEAEWEKAARGGMAGHRFPWSDTDTIQHARANYYSDASYMYDTSPTRGYHPTFYTGLPPFLCTSPAEYFAPNGYGLYDMTGNVWEWCNDWASWGYYISSPYDNPHGPSSGSDRVLRGGSWGSDAYTCRCATRFSRVPGTQYSHLGFRLALDAE